MPLTDYGDRNLSGDTDPGSSLWNLDPEFQTIKIRISVSEIAFVFVFVWLIQSIACHVILSPLQQTVRHSAIPFATLLHSPLFYSALLCNCRYPMHCSQRDYLNLNLDIRTFGYLHHPLFFSYLLFHLPLDRSRLFNLLQNITTTPLL